MRSARTTSTLVTAALLLLAGTQPAVAQNPGTRELLAYAASYVADFVVRFANVVTEERYEQWSVNGLQRRNLVSDFLIVQIPATNDWSSFRDVFEVDGEQVGDRQQRLLSLLLDNPSSSVLERARAMTQESARFNLDGAGEFNNPLLVLAFVQRQYNDRFKWEVTGSEPTLGPDVWKMEFEEEARPTLIRASGNRNLPATGAVWVEALTGRVLQTQLRVSSADVTTRFKSDPAFGIAVPVEMRESHFAGRDIIRAVAAYGRFRSFSIDTSESFDDTPAP
jgi:hypothetical protein